MFDDPKREIAGKSLGEFVQWACAQEISDIPPLTRQRAVLVLADDIAAMYSAQSEPQVKAYHNRLIANSAGGEATLYRAGRPQLTLTEAALGNALAASWNELDEGYRLAVCHAGLYSVPILLAMAEVSEQYSIGDVIRALVLSYETSARFAKTWRAEPLNIHPHALYNALGVASASGYLRRLSPEIMLGAIANASTLGVVGPYSQAVCGSLVRNTWAAAGIQNGMNAVDWSLDGIKAVAQTPHDVYHGSLHTQANLHELTQGLGEDWAINSGYHKLNAACQYTHSAIEAIQKLLAEQPDLAGGKHVKSLEIQTHRLGMTLVDRNPRTTLGAKFSMPHAVATALVHGHGGASAFGTESLQHPEVKRLRDAVQMSLVAEDKPWPHDRPAHIEVIDFDGQVFGASCVSARGGPDLPFSREEIWAKVGELTAQGAPGLVQAMTELQDFAGEVVANPALDMSWRDWVKRFF